MTNNIFLYIRLPISSVGCYPDAFRLSSPVGTELRTPCNDMHPSFNPRGSVAWVCKGHLDWQGDFSACTLKMNQENSIAILQYLVYGIKIQDVNETEVLFTVSTKCLVMFVMEVKNIFTYMYESYLIHSIITKYLCSFSS